MTDPTARDALKIEQRHWDAAKELYSTRVTMLIHCSKDDLAQAFATFERAHMQQPTQAPIRDEDVEQACDAFMNKITVDGNGGIEFLEEGILAALSAMTPRPQELSFSGDNSVSQSEDGANSVSQAQAQVDAEPVAWMYDGPDGQHYIHEHRDIAHRHLIDAGWTETPLYATPPTPSDSALREALENLTKQVHYFMPYADWAIGPESPGYHPTMPSAVGQLRTALMDAQAALSPPAQPQDSE